MSFKLNNQKNIGYKQLKGDKMHLFNVDIAIKYGINYAVLINHLAFWQQKNQANEKNCFDGYYWTFNSAKAFEELLPYFNEQQIKRMLKKLEDDRIIKSGNYNKMKFDRTKWYTIVDEYVSQIYSLRQSNLTNGEFKNNQPIPDINTDNKPYIKNYNKKDLNIPFEDVWDLYDYKKSKHKSEEKWNKLSDKERVQAIQTIPAYLKDTPEVKYRKQLITFLNQKTWEDYLDQTSDKVIDKAYNEIIKNVKRGAFDFEDVKRESIEFGFKHPELKSNLIVKLKDNKFVKDLKGFK